MDPCAESFFSSQARIGRVQQFFPGCVLEMSFDTANPYHYTQTQGEIQHVLNIFFGVLGDYLKTLGLCPRLKPSLPPAPSSSITSILSKYTQSLLYPSSALQLLGFYHYHLDPSSLLYFSHPINLTCCHIDNVHQQHAYSLEAPD